VVDVPLDDNIFLGHNWSYIMMIVVSMVFPVICFPFERKIITID